jgi:hypothetical protein
MADVPLGLRQFDVFDFPLRIAVHWTDEGFLVELVVITAVQDRGYSSVVLLDYAKPYEAEHRGDTENRAVVDAVVAEAVTFFGQRLAQVLRA